MFFYLWVFCNMIFWACLRASRRSRCFPHYAIASEVVQKVRFCPKIKFLTICKSIYYNFDFRLRLPFLDSSNLLTQVCSKPLTQHAQPTIFDFDLNIFFITLQYENIVRLFSYLLIHLYSCPKLACIRQFML